MTKNSNPMRQLTLAVGAAGALITAVLAPALAGTGGGAATGGTSYDDLVAAFPIAAFMATVESDEDELVSSVTDEEVEDEVEADDDQGDEVDEVGDDDQGDDDQGEDADEQGDDDDQGGGHHRHHDSNAAGETDLAHPRVAAERFAQFAAGSGQALHRLGGETAL